jgi:hypothetical protein
MIAFVDSAFVCSSHAGEMIREATEIGDRSATLPPSHGRDLVTKPWLDRGGDEAQKASGEGERLAR